MANAIVKKIKLGSTTYDIKDNSGTKSTHTHTTDQITDFPVIPAKDSDLTNDRYVRYDINSQGLNATQKTNARTNIGAGTSSFSGSYTDLTNKPTIPTYTSQLTNDSEFVTETWVGNNYLLKTDIYDWAKASTKPSYTLSEITNRYDTLLGFSSSAPNVVGGISAIGMAISPEHGANRLAFLNGDALKFEYSTDGTNFSDFGYAKDTKTQFVTGTYGVPVGRGSSSAEYNIGSKSRVTISGTNASKTAYLYCSPKKLLINISSSGGMNVLVETRTGTNTINDGSWSTYGTYQLSGWSGWNEIPLVLGTLGGGSSQTSNNWQLRLTFIMTSKNTQYPTTAAVNCIRLFADNLWTSPSTMASTGHLYSYDTAGNASFPKTVNAVGGLQENGTSLSSKYLGISAKAADSDKLDNHDSSYFATATHTHQDYEDRITALETALDGLLARLTAI